MNVLTPRRRKILGHKFLLSRDFRIGHHARRMWLSHESVEILGAFIFSLMIVVGASFSMRIIDIVWSSQSVSDMQETVRDPLSRYLFDIPAAFAENTHWQARVVSQNVTDINMDPGRGYTIEVQLENTGSVTWKNTGEHFVALNVIGPTGRHSAFRHRFWPAYYRPALLSESSVAPGEIGTVRFAVQAPMTEGWYAEEYKLVAENLTFIDGSEITVNIRVGNPRPHWRAELVSVSPAAVHIEPGKATTVEVTFKNTGSVTWHNDTGPFVAMNTTNPAGRDSAFLHIFWHNAYRPSILNEASVAPDETGTFRFALQAPATEGVYTESFALVAENLTWIPGGTVDVVVTVADIALAVDEPLIRVGLYNPDDNRMIVSADSAYTIQDGGGNILATMTSSDATTVSYASGVYTATSGTMIVTSADALRLAGANVGTVFTIIDYENHPAWNEALNDNTFRSTIEMHYAPSTDKLWVINELPLELYLRGIGEASDNESAEYLKTLLTAARTYALYHYQHPAKHADEPYLLNASAGDQVYIGYGFESRAPHVTAAVKATEGVVVTFDNDVVVTPYFSHSDGRTRAWEEVWSGGPYPWLQSVDDPCCADMDLSGHGVGLSALGARGMAEAGLSYQDILAYYYTGVVLQKVY